MKKCKKCGRPMGNNEFCSVCDRDKILAAKQKQAKKNEKKNSRKTLWMIIGIAAACLAILTVALLLTQCGDASVHTTAADTPDASDAPQTTAAAATTDLTGKHHVEIEIADYGTIALELDADAAPITVANFLKLANEGFYDGLTFHRIMENFMMQGGDPEGTGNGGASETIKGEFSANGVENPLSHTRGAISMARNSISMDSASSQFFIVHQDSQFLDGQYACFGYVTSGIEIVDAVCTDAQPVDNNGTILPEQQPVITAVRVID